MRGSTTALAVLVVALTGMAVLTSAPDGAVAQSTGSKDGGGMFNDYNMQIVVGMVFLAVVGASALGLYRRRLGQALRDLAVWLALGAMLVAAYGFRDEFRMIGHRMFGELMPPGETQTIEQAAVEGRDRAVRIRKRSDGHFVAKTEVNGVVVTMLVDTGASSVVLRPADARLAGIDVDRLTFSVPVQTANGTAYAAAVRLKRLSIGGISADGIEALVAKPGTLGESLLGMTFLRRLRSYEFSGEFLTLRS
jgi:aspartyl protease family protein